MYLKYISSYMLTINIEYIQIINLKTKSIHLNGANKVLNHVYILFFWGVVVVEKLKLLCCSRDTCTNTCK